MYPKNRNIKAKNRKINKSLSLLVWLFSFFIAGYFIYDFFIADSKALQHGISVRGVERIRELDDIKKNANITFEKLFQTVLGAPEKKETAGNFYTRSKSSVVIDAKTHTILHNQNGKRKTAIASLTKIMTAMVVLDKTKDLENEIVTIDEETVLVEGTKVGCPRTGYCISNRLRVGEKLTVQSLLEAMLMNSANDASIALAKHIAGSQQEFAELMNEKARELGLEDTNFCNPSGLDEESRPGGCYSSAYDFARIAAFSLKYDEIWKAMKYKEKDIYAENMDLTHHIVNTDILIDQMPNCLGGKTGFTYEAGKSLMMAAHDPYNKDNKIISVMIDNPYRWQDTKELIDWIFAAYQWPE